MKERTYTHKHTHLHTFNIIVYVSTYVMCENTMIEWIPNCFLSILLLEQKFEKLWW